MIKQEIYDIQDILVLDEMEIVHDQDKPAGLPGYLIKQYAR